MPEGKPPLVQNNQPDSWQEFWLAEALTQFKIDFWFQYEIAGGLRLRGGLIIDFLLKLRDIPLEYYGDYWHEDEMSGEDLTRLKAIEDYFGVKPIILWEHEASTRSEVFTWVKNNIL